MGDPVQDLLKEGRDWFAKMKSMLPDAEARMKAIESANAKVVQDIINSRDVLGDPNVVGSSRLCVFQGLLIGVLNPTTGNAQYTGTGHFLNQGADINANKIANVWLHFKLPLSTDITTQMFHLGIRGYLYGSSGIINETLVGYCYQATKSLLQTRTMGNYNPLLYKGSDGFIYARLTLPSVYIVSIAIDSMKVGYGQLFKVGSILPIVSADKEFI